MKNQQSNSRHCISYAPGHNVHWIQAKVKREEPRYDVVVEILSDTTLRLIYLDQVETFYHHNVLVIQYHLERAVLDYIKFSPISSILYIQTEEPTGQHKGAFALHYLAGESLSDCVIRVVGSTGLGIELEEIGPLNTGDGVPTSA
jgi:hypothetical protein